MACMYLCEPSEPGISEILIRDHAVYLLLLLLTRIIS